MKNVAVFGSEIKSYVEELGKDFVECAYLVDIFYELLEENNLPMPKSEDYVYSDDEIDVLLNAIYDNRDLSDEALGLFVCNKL